MKTDIDLRHDVEDELEWEPSINANKIGVAVTDGIVTLTGEVKSYAERWYAERAAERVEGVRGVVNEIEVQVADKRTDTEIAKAAADALEWNALVPDDRVTVKVANGWVTLKGDLDHDYQRRAAERAVRVLPGVKGVSNMILVKPKVQPKDVKEEIEKTFRRQAMIDAVNISVEVNGHEVILRGTVRSWSERHEAEKAAAAAPGVSSVKNFITVRTAAAA